MTVFNKEATAQIRDRPRYDDSARYDKTLKHKESGC